MLVDVAESRVQLIVHKLVHKCELVEEPVFQRTIAPATVGERS